jgi:hypothetical protein
MHNEKAEAHTDSREHRGCCRGGLGSHGRHQRLLGLAISSAPCTHTHTHTDTHTQQGEGSSGPGPDTANEAEIHVSGQTDNASPSDRHSEKEAGARPRGVPSTALHSLLLSFSRYECGAFRSPLSMLSTHTYIRPTHTYIRPPCA